MGWEEVVDQLASLTPEPGEAIVWSGERWEDRPIAAAAQPPKRIYGHGPPQSVLGANPGDEYVDLGTWNIYILD